MSDIVFMDTETLGVHLASPIWEFAAIRRNSDGSELSLHLLIHHDVHPWFDDLPEQFQRDYLNRWDGAAAIEQDHAADRICAFLADRPHIVGAVPNFDTERIDHQLLHPHGLVAPWHYHLVDVENLAVGYLRGLYAAQGQAMPIDPPWKSDELSAAIGVDPAQFDRHTAMGDVLWVRAQYDAIMGGAA